MPKYTYDDTLGLFKDQNGATITQGQIELELMRYADQVANRLAQLTQNYYAGLLSLNDWQSRFLLEVKQLNTVATIIAGGGLNNVHLEQLRQLGIKNRDEAAYLEGFAKAIANPDDYSEGRALWRSRLYAQSVRQQYFTSLNIQRAADGYLGRRYLDPRAEHCPQCPLYVTPGFTSIGSIVGIGEACQCGGNCRCVIIYRKAGDLSLEQLRREAEAAYDAALNASVTPANIEIVNDLLSRSNIEVRIIAPSRNDPRQRVTLARAGRIIN